MKDTPAEIEARFLRQLMSLTPGERLAMACRMFSDAKALVCAQGPDEKPRSAAETRRLVFLRFYGDDFSEEERARILEHLRA